MLLRWRWLLVGLLLLLLLGRWSLLVSGVATLHHGLWPWGHVGQDMGRLMDRSEPEMKNKRCELTKGLLGIKSQAEDDQMW